MALGTGRGSAASPDVAYMGKTASSQLKSTFFGQLPLEIREMIYTECFVASDLKQHIYQNSDGRVTHSPCVFERGEVDERNHEIQRLMDRQGQNRRGSRSRSSLVVDEVWAARFSSPWHEHWRCKEEMVHSGQGSQNPLDVADGQPDRRHRTLFLPILLLCKRTYLEAFQILYASATFVFTDLETAHRTLVSPNKAFPTNILRSLNFSFSESYDTFHQHRTSDLNGPWSQLCIRLSDMARFSALRSVTLRLSLAGSHDEDEGDWWRVRERWILSPIRGILARCLTVQLPDTAHPEWSRRYQYADGDKTLFRLERYKKMQWISVGDGRHVESLLDPSSRTSSEGRPVEPGGSILQKATRGLKGLVRG
ncbi:hypothetical protein F5Y16DRAFT_357556 [Xylariaceae sp. FL0255]|nr:hypothetical protein F5Y16DRAFT_357556 [Xylariaceae sp. FL0255]